jgi:PII interaction protein X
MLDPILPDAAKVQMNPETYLNHPTFGLLFRVCLIEENRELFFVVTTQTDGTRFEPIGRADARILVESRLRELRRSGQHQEYTQLQVTHKQTFQ